MSDIQHIHDKLLQDFYLAFTQKNAEAMLACYHPEVVFNDPIFKNLNYEEVGAMWKMLLSKSESQLQVTFDKIETTENKGKVYWEAKYLFGKHKKPVHNKVWANFEFENKQIIKHSDKFDFWKWSSMALGSTGYFLGFTPIIKNKVRKYANTNLQNYILKRQGK